MLKLAPRTLQQVVRLGTFIEKKCLVIDLSLSDESHAQHDDSSDQDLDEEHRIGGLGTSSGKMLVTSGSRERRFFGVSIFDLGGSLGINGHVVEHRGTILRSDPDPTPIPE